VNRNEKISFLSERVNLDGIGLELGPHVAPLFRKSRGARVKYLETRPTEDIRAAMVKAGRDPSIVEDIDFVHDFDKDLSENVGGETFDWVASSHVLEHIPNFVGHLNDVRAVLREGGIYAAIVPDRNLCFDCLKSPSTLGDVVQAHLENRRYPTIASNVDELRYCVRPEGIKVGGWTVPQAGGALVAKYPGWEVRVRGILAAVTAGKARPDLFSGHSWRFDPVSFAQILADLCRLDLIGMQLTELVPTYNMDFIAILKKVPAVAPGAVAQIGRLVAEEYDPPRYPQALPV